MSLIVLFEVVMDGRKFRVVDLPSDGTGPSVQEHHDRGQYAGFWLSWTVDEGAEAAVFDAWRKAKEEGR